MNRTLLFLAPVALSFSPVNSHGIHDGNWLRARRLGSFAPFLQKKAALKGGFFYAAWMRFQRPIRAKRIKIEYANLHSAFAPAANRLKPAQSEKLRDSC